MAFNPAIPKYSRKSIQGPGEVIIRSQNSSPLILLKYISIPGPQAQRGDITNGEGGMTRINNQCKAYFLNARNQIKEKVMYLSKFTFHSIIILNIKMSLIGSFHNAFRLCFTRLFSVNHFMIFNCYIYVQWQTETSFDSKISGLNKISKSIPLFKIRPQLFPQNCTIAYRKATLGNIVRK